jgi:HK97 family phage major capsid protein
MTPEQMEEVALKVAAKMIEASKGQRDEVAKSLAPAHVEAPRASIVVGDTVASKSGIGLARMMKALAVGRMRGVNPAEVAKGWGYSDVAKALGQSDFANGGSLVHPAFASEFIELLRNQTVIRKAGVRQIPMGASLTFDGQTGAATASYGGSTTAATPSNLTTGQPLVLSEKKLTGLVPVPNDLLRNASVSAEEIVRDDLMRVMALTEDLKFLYGTGSVFEPRGLQSQIRSANKYAMTALTTSSKPTIGELKNEINKAKRVMKKANAPMSKCFWVLSPTVEAGILNAVGPGGEGYNTFEREMNERGTIAGFPYFVTNQIPESSSADLFLFDASEIIIGDSMSLELEFFPNAAFSQSGQVVSGISTDQSCFRAIAKHDIGLRHDVSGVNVTGVTWGF